jgi:glutamate racemase
LVFIGVEPGVKPAAARSTTRRIAVMSTAATARSDRLRHLIARYAEDVHVHVQACHGLASVIERGLLEGQVLDRVLRPHCDAIRAAGVDTVVLGCTHYALVDTAIRAAMGDGVTLIDTAQAVADRSATLWSHRLPAFDPSPRVRILSTGATEAMQRLAVSCAGLREARAERLEL